jgi:putative hydrolase
VSAADGARDRAGNAVVSERLEEVAALLEQQGANPFRAQAYRNAAQTVRELREPVARIVETEGVEGLDRLPGIGQALARAIAELSETGRLGTLERLRGEHDPVALLASVPGIGPTFAQRLHDELEIGTLEELELAANDGTLARLPGFGEKRVAGIRDALATRLGRRRRAPPPRAHGEPDVAELLDVDREYRERAAAGDLPTIAPRRFNPTGEAWLPVLHTARGDRHYTALFSNTARAHQLGRTRDWVVLYHDDGAGGERQNTVVTAASGALAGERVVRGREAACAAHHRRHAGEHAAEGDDA